MKFSLVIPCYNEGENIPLLIKRLEDIFTFNDMEIILVNNGSTDNTQLIMENCVSDFSNIKVLNIRINKGYGYGILEGLKISKGKILGWTHADLQTDPADSLKALKLFDDLDTDKLFVKGLRKGRSYSDQFFTFFMSIFEFMILGKFMWDINAQPSIFNRELYENWIDPPKDFSLDLYAYYKAKEMNYKIKRFAVNFPPRKYGESKWNFSFRSKLKFIKRTIIFSLNLKNKFLK